MLSTELRPEIWLSMKSWRFWAFAFGKSASALSSAAWFASDSPPCIFTNEYRFRGFGVWVSQTAADIVTGPNGDPPVGGLKIPLTTNLFVVPLAKVTSTGE